MKGWLLGKTRSALMLLTFVTAQPQFSALAVSASPPPPPPPPPPSLLSSDPDGQHPKLLTGYKLRPPWQVAGVDYRVGLPSMTTLTDWRLLKGPGITVNATATLPYVRVDNKTNAVISGVDFSLHGGAVLFFVDSPNPTVVCNKFGGPNLVNDVAYVIYADSDSPGLTVSHNTIDGSGNGSASSLVGTAGGGTLTLTHNWLKNFPQHVLEMNFQGGAPYSVIYKYNLIEQGAMAPGAHLNYLQFGTNSNSSLAVDVEFNTSYQTRQASQGEGYQFYSNGTGLIKNVTFAYNVMIAAAPGTNLPVPPHLLSMSNMVHGGGSPNAGIAHDNFVDKTAAYFWLYANSFTGWNFYDNYNMTTGTRISS